MDRPRVGASSCLLGNRVRYNGDSTECEWITKILSTKTDLVPFCLEVSMGLGVPRPTIRLIKKDNGDQRLVEGHTERDLTDLARKTFNEMANEVSVLDGFILKKNSPSCGLERVKIYDSLGVPSRSGTGVFAQRLIEEFPNLPVIEEGRLSDPEQRDHFLCQVYSYHRLKKVTANVKDIQRFHRAHKLLLFEYSPLASSRLGLIAANTHNLAPSKVVKEYTKEFMATLKSSRPTKKNRTNALMHAAGYLRGKADVYDRKNLLSCIEGYRQGELPFVAPLILLQHLVAKFNITYLEEQVFFGPFPKVVGSQGRI